MVPERVISGSPYFERDLVGLRPAAGSSDLDRRASTWCAAPTASSGSWRTTCAPRPGWPTRSRCPRSSPRCWASTGPGSDLEVGIPAALRRCLEATAPDVDGALVLLTDGPTNTAYYEHQRLAELADLVGWHHPPTCEPTATCCDSTAGERVRAVYRRTNDDGVRDESGELTDLARLLLPGLRAGTVGLANWFGTGVADDKSVYAYVDDLVRHFLGEEPIIASVPTYDLAEPDQLAVVLDRLGSSWSSRATGTAAPGSSSVRLPRPRSWTGLRAEVRRAPELWVAQEVVSLSTHDTVIDGELEPRHVDLRPVRLLRRHDA